MNPLLRRCLALPAGLLLAATVSAQTPSVPNSNIFLTPNAIGAGRAPSTSGILDVDGKAIFRGPLDLARTANATAEKATSSAPLLFHFQTYNSTLHQAVNPYFSFQADPTGNSTASPSGALHFLYYNGTGTTPTDTGLSFNPDGTINFSAAQTTTQLLPIAALRHSEPPPRAF